METLLIAIGNPLRRDDGAARRVVELLGPLPPGVSAREVHQLTPEIAEEIAGFDGAVFIDAAVCPSGGPAGKVRLTEIGQGTPAAPAPLAHYSTAEEILALARRLFGFTGRAWVCAVPGVDFSTGEGLSPLAESCARRAAQALRELLLTR